MKTDMKSKVLEELIEKLHLMPETMGAVKEKGETIEAPNSGTKLTIAIGDEKPLLEDEEEEDEE